MKFTYLPYIKDQNTRKQVYKTIVNEDEKCVYTE